MSKRSTEYHLGHLYIRDIEQDRGIGTIIMRRLLNRAQSEGVAVTLDVMKNNRAQNFYERLRFKAVGASEYKIEMRWQAKI